MLVFVDESGDLGRKLGRDSSQFFTVALVVFENTGDAQTCQAAIEALRVKKGFGADQEFKFHDDNHKLRLAFLQTVSNQRFTCRTFTLNKASRRLNGPGFAHPGPAYKWVCSTTLANAKPFLTDATVVIDGSGNRLFRQQMSTYLRRQINTPEQPHIRRVKIGRSHSDPLLQLADYVAGVTNRGYEAKPGSEVYERFLRAKRRSKRLWPQK
ncbi:MAG TPA: DUF3800 domain-containing protein [Dehalococcoidia bacterium]|nr:DUF3800 domain-containing protein [Dehalococcoidia bacterium]